MTDAQPSPSQIGAKTRMSDDPQVSEEELDRWQASWVIGRQRGKKFPVTREHLVALIDNHRLSWNTLDTQEKDWLEQDQHLTDKIISWRDESGAQTTTDINQKAVNVAAKIVKTLLVDLDTRYPEETRGWENLVAQDKDSQRQKLFVKVYQKTPKLFAYDLYQSLTGANHGR